MVTPVSVELAAVSMDHRVSSIRACVLHSRTPNAHAVASANCTGNSRFGDVVRLRRELQPQNTGCLRQELNSPAGIRTYFRVLNHKTPLGHFPSLSFLRIQVESKTFSVVWNSTSLWSSRLVKGSNSRGRASGLTVTTAKKALISLCQKAAELACWTRTCRVSI